MASRCFTQRLYIRSLSDYRLDEEFHFLCVLFLVVLSVFPDHDGGFLADCVQEEAEPALACLRSLSVYREDNVSSLDSGVRKVQNSARRTSAILSPSPSYSVSNSTPMRPMLTFDL
jgi:hypothetical protein